MIEAIHIPRVSTVGLIGFVLLGLCLFALLRALRRLVGLLPISRARRQTLRQVLPLLDGLIAVVFVLSAMPLVIDADARVTTAVVAVVALGLGALSWFAIRDLVHGMFLRASDACRVGDHVRIEDVAGRVRRLDQRVVVLETATGDEVLIPYSRVSRERITRTPTDEGFARHTFEVPFVAGRRVADLRDAILRAALTSHWSSIARDPIIELRDDGVGFAVTVFALEATRGPEIEAAVLRAVEPPREAGEVA